jgi:hypothetical protein
MISHEFIYQENAQNNSVNLHHCHTQAKELDDIRQYIRMLVPWI